MPPSNCRCVSRSGMLPVMTAAVHSGLLFIISRVAALNERRVRVSDRQVLLSLSSEEQALIIPCISFTGFHCGQRERVPGNVTDPVSVASQRKTGRYRVKFRLFSNFQLAAQFVTPRCFT